MFKMIKSIELSGLKDKFIFLPLVPNTELFAFYSAGDVGVWPKQCSLTMIEAMACGLPITIADDSGVLDRVSHENGLLYRSGDVDDLKVVVYLYIKYIWIFRGIISTKRIYQRLGIIFTMLQFLSIAAFWIFLSYHFLPKIKIGISYLRHSLNISGYHKNLRSYVAFNGGATVCFPFRLNVK